MTPPEPVDPVPAPTGLSLIERAAKVYDFGEQLRARRSLIDDLPPPPVAAPAETPVPIGAPPPVPTPVVPAPIAAAPVEERYAPVSADDAAPFVPPPGFDQDAPVEHAPRAAPAGAPAFVAPRADGNRVEAIDRARLAQMGMIVPGAPIGSLAEEFRLIKRQLLLTAGKMAGVAARTILVGSARPGDGKTWCAINLALSIAAERDTEVLLVDADFAKPDVMARLGLDDGPGLLDALADPDLDPEALVVRTDVPHLALLPVGAKSHGDTELLASRRTGEVLDRLLAADPRRLILFDTPPALAASPASVLALHVGQVMLVVRADRTTEGEVRRAVQLLDGCDEIQLVLNSVSFVPGGNRFGSYYGQGE
ncbi:MAG: chromosome partitioning ATPase [Janthinobacterium lividum]